MEVDVSPSSVDLLFEDGEDGHVLEASSLRSDLLIGLYTVRILPFG